MKRHECWKRAPADIMTIEEAARRAFQIGMGPFQLMNVTGIPIAVHAATTLGNELGPFYAPCDLLKARMDIGGTGCSKAR